MSPLPSGLTELFGGFRRVMTVELNYSDPADDPAFTGAPRRYAMLAQLLREKTLHDVDCWSRVPGSPLQPGRLEAVLEEVLDDLGGA